MIGSGILLLLTLLVTVGWLYVEITDALGTVDYGQDTRDDEAEADV
jgi:hypothetical protein